MITKEQLIEQAKTENPKPMYRTDNGVQIELTETEYDEAINNWAEMRIHQIAVEQAEEEKQAARNSARLKLATFGLTEQEIDAMLGGI